MTALRTNRDRYRPQKAMSVIEVALGIALLLVTYAITRDTWLVTLLQKAVALVFGLGGLILIITGVSAITKWRRLSSPKQL